MMQFGHDNPFLSSQTNQSIILSSRISQLIVDSGKREKQNAKSNLAVLGTGDSLAVLSLILFYQNTKTG